MRKRQVFKHEYKITRAQRERLNGHKSFVLWFTGLSGSGKSTIASKVEEKLYKAGVRTMILDGDNVRLGLNKNLGFSPEDRTENIRRVAEVAKLFVDSGAVVLVTFISPYGKDRRNARALFRKDDFVEIFVKCDINECKKRDPKKLYSKASRGEIPSFTGVSAPYEEPSNPQLTLPSDSHSSEELAHEVILYLKKKKLI